MRFSEGTARQNYLIYSAIESARRDLSIGTFISAKKLDFSFGGLCLSTTVLQIHGPILSLYSLLSKQPPERRLCESSADRNTLSSRLDTTPSATMLVAGNVPMGTS